MAEVGLDPVRADSASSSVSGAGFALDPLQAAALTAEVNSRLRSSLRYVFDQVGPDLGCDTEQFRAWLESISGTERPDPLVHVLFHAIVAEVENNDVEAARRLAARLPGLGTAPDRLIVRSVEADEDSDRPVALFSRFADIEEDNNLDFTVPERADVERATALIAAGLDLIARHDPDLDREVRTLMTDLLLTSQGPAHLFVAGAVSCFQNWGALLINPTVQQDALDIVELLAHEATHQLLFAFALDEPLLTNPPELLYYSPLREAMRSMDGVYHATIVSARVARAMMRQVAALDGDDMVREAALARARRSARTFEDGVGIIEADAQLTPLGRSILDEAKAYMEILGREIADGQSSNG